MTRGFTLDRRPSELERDLQVLDFDTIANVRESLFREAKVYGMTGEGSTLVQRKKTNGGKSIRQKHTADVILLVRSIQNKSLLPRTILRNGKRSAEEWQARQARMNSESEQTSQTFTMNSGTDKSDSNQLPQNLESINHNNPIPPQSPETESVNTPHCSGVPVEDKIFRSTVVRDIGSLKSSVDVLKAELQQLKGAIGKCEGPQSDMDTCIIYVRFKKSSDEQVTKIMLEFKLNSSVLAYDIIRFKPTTAFRVKIHKSTLHHALSHARENGCIADLWRGVRSRWSPPSVHQQSTQNSCSLTFLTITAWNCRGLATACPYLHKLFECDSDIVILSEHWL